ncbi:MAG: sigma-70 family RNA polymerase sigma factor [Verrucomicrobiales bacterium]|nr:sigma-70 family RNA polymerase sigma factor [Verrucomicrobiales bacterium]
MTDHDRQLLRRYADTGSEDAFRELVNRQVDLVYSTALRSLAGDTALAEDVTQTVFADLARKAGTLPDGVAVAGWLYQASRFAAAKAARGEQRRRTREAVALETLMNPSEPEPDWDRIRPLIDEAMESLPAADRDAVVLRFFQRRDLNEVGAVLGLSDDAARKRVSRALDRLRDILSRRGITTSSGALAMVISFNAVGAAPTGLAALAATSSLAAGSATGAAIAFKLLPSMVMTKTQTALLTAVLAAGIATPLVIHQRDEGRRLAAQVQALQAQLAERTSDTVAPMPPPARTDSLDAEDKAELLRLRGEVARYRAQNPAPIRTGVAGRAGQPIRARGRFTPDAPLSSKPGYVPAGQYQFAGFATPHDAVQSFLWAAQNPEAGQLLGTLALPEEVRRNLPVNGQEVAVGLGLPPAVPREGGEPALDVVGQAGADPSPVQSTGYRIASEEDLGPNAKRVEVERELPDGTVVSEAHTLRKQGDEWKVEPGTGMQVSFDTGDGRKMLFNSGPDTGGDGSDNVRQTVEIQAPGAPGKSTTP